MRAEQDRDAPRFEIQDQVADFARTGGIHPGCRLIQHKQPRLLHQRLRQTYALQHPFRVAAQPPVAGVLQAHQFQQFSRAIPELRAAQTADFSVEHEGLEAGEIFVKIGILGQKPHVLATVHHRAVAAENLRSPGSRRHEAQHNFHRGALSRAIRAQQSVHLARLHIQGKIFYRKHPFTPEGDRVYLCKIADGNCGGCHLLRGRFTDRGIQFVFPDHSQECVHFFHFARVGFQ